MLAANTLGNSGQAAMHVTYHHPATSLEMPAGYTPPTKTIEEALSDSGIVAIHEHLDGSWTIYLSDTGGQMEFQEILPVLMSGPSLFFVVFPLHRDLNELFMIEYQLPDGQQSKPYQSTLTLKEAILQSLATIAAMHTFTYKGIGHENVEQKPKVVLVGTHKDKLDCATAQARIKEIDSNLQQTLKSMSYRDSLVEFASEDQLIFTVNNLAEEDDDFARIRERVNEIARYGGYEMGVPTHWLIFSFVIRALTSSVISIEECRKVAQQCGIGNSELTDALSQWFLHTKMGVIRYFPVGGLSDIVIIHPELLFNMITELFIKTFTFEKGRPVSEEFKKKGIFSFDSYERLKPTHDTLLTPLFIEFLKQLYTHCRSFS